VDASIREATLVDGAAALADERSRRAAAGAPIRSARKCLNVTQASLAEKAGINAAVLSEIERGIRVPDPATRDRIAHALDADTEHLFGRLEATVT